MYYCAEYHALIKQFDVSDQILAKVLKVCKANHVTYYLPRVKLLQANNAINADRSPEEVKHLLDEAMVFARFNDNNVAEVQAAALLSNYEKIIRTN